MPTTTTSDKSNEIETVHEIDNEIDIENDESEEDRKGCTMQEYEIMKVSGMCRRKLLFFVI